MQSSRSRATTGHTYVVEIRGSEFVPAQISVRTGDTIKWINRDIVPHMVYVDPVSWAHYKKTGEFREGTVLAKELTRVRAPDGANENGSTDEVSGTGYFMGEFSGFEITIKSKALYPDDPGNWAYYTFGHQPEPYNSTAMKQPAEACNACHEASAAEDFVFSQFYPVLRAAKPK